MIIMEELEILSIDIFVDINITTKFSGKAKSIDIAPKYNLFVRNHRSTDNRKKYMFGFIIMANEFRKYWTPVQCSDRIVMEHIQNHWIGVHLLSGKHTCV